MAKPLIILLSPHLDDGILSCGGFIARNHEDISIELWTIFCGSPLMGPYSPLAKWLHGVSGISNSYRLSRARMKEDQKACAELGITAIHLNYRDSVYRRSKSRGDFIYRQCQNKRWDPEDNPLVDAITRHLKTLLPRQAVILAPLGIGQHVDHLITNEIAKHLDCKALLFYPEAPYTGQHPKDFHAKTAGLEKLQYSVSSEHLQQWAKAVECYTTQIRMLEEAVGLLPIYLSQHVEQGHCALYGNRKDTAHLQEIIKFH